MKQLFIAALLLLSTAIGRAQFLVIPVAPDAEQTAKLQFTPEERHDNFAGKATAILAHFRFKQNSDSEWKTVELHKTEDGYATEIVPENLFPKTKQGKMLVKFSDKNEMHWALNPDSLPFSFYVGDYATDYYTGYEVSNGRVTVKGEKGQYHIDFFNDETVRIGYESKEVPNPDSSHAIIREPLQNEPDVKTYADSLMICLGKEISGRLQIVVEKSPLLFHFYKEGRHLFSEAQGFFNRPDFNGFRIKLKPDEFIYGTGARSIPVNRRGHKIELYNQPHYGYGEGAPNLNYSVPVWSSSENYLVLFDNAQKGYMDIGHTEKDVLEVGSMGGNFDYVIAAGDSPKETIQLYSWLTGFQPMPPIWALGNLQSRFGYETQQQATNVVDSMVDAGYPLDALIIDLFWFGDGEKGKYYMGNLSWDEDRWPQPEKMMRQFKEKGVKTVLITEPYILTNSSNWEYAKTNNILAEDSSGQVNVIDNFYFGDAGLIDIFKPRARDWFWKQYKRQIENNVDGWWGDLGEPETHPADLVHAAGLANEVHNIYGHYWHKMLYNRYAQEYPDTRLFNLNRSGFAGSQRYAVYPWSGDVARSWSGFRAQLPVMLGMSVSGLGYMHSDLGGFAMGTKDEELFTRWLQFGVFNPVFRPHGSEIPSEPIYYSDKTQDIIRRYIKLRYRLMPYNYTLAWENASQGLPLTRPLYMQYPNDERFKNVVNTYTWGDAFLVAPVLQKGAEKRIIPLPQGKWYDFWDYTVYEGGKDLTYEVTLQNIPVFVKAGSFIPEVPEFYTTDNYSTDTLMVKCYPLLEEGNYSYKMYADDGKTKGAYREGAYEMVHFKANEGEEQLRISIKREGGVYEGRPDSRVIIMQFPEAMPFSSATVNNEKQELVHNENKDLIQLAFKQKDEAIQIVLMQN